MIKRMSIALTALALAMGLAACKDMSGKLTTQVAVTGAQIQEKVSARFPIERSQGDVKITLSNPKVNLDGGRERLLIDTDLLVRLPTMEVGRRGRTVTPPALTGKARVEGSITYDKAAGVVYFDSGDLKELKLDQLPPDVMVKVKAAASSSVQEKLARIPVFVLDEAKLEHQAAKHLLQGVKVTDGALEVEVGLASE